MIDNLIYGFQQVDNASGKIDDIVATVAINVEQRCQCGFTPDQITSSAFRCFPDSPQAVTYRAVLHGTANASSSDIISHIEEWVSEDAAISVQNDLINVDTNCDIEIFSDNDSECSGSTASSFSFLLYIIVGGAAGALLLILVLCTLMMTTLILKRKKEHRRVKLDKLR